MARGLVEKKNYWVPVEKYGGKSQGRKKKVKGGSLTPRWVLGEVSSTGGGLGRKGEESMVTR